MDEQLIFLRPLFNCTIQKVRLKGKKCLDSKNNSFTNLCDAELNKFIICSQIYTILYLIRICEKY